VAADLIANKQTEYKRLGSIINDARLAGLIDWNAIEDRGRNLIKPSTWSDPGEIIRAVARSYATDLWATQDYRVEVWVEKEALIGVISRAADLYQVPSFACKGYTSQSEMWRAGRRFKRYRANGQLPVVIHLGDHDPSGIDMSRDIKERLGMFAEENVIVRRIALNIDQVQQYNPPPNPAKLTDTRAGNYVKRFGSESWELDALEPQVLNDIIVDEINVFRDAEKYEALLFEMSKERRLLELLADNWLEYKEELEEQL
jgi:hypothetical protein